MMDAERISRRDFFRVAGVSVAAGVFFGEATSEWPVTKLMIRELARKDKTEPAMPTAAPTPVVEDTFMPPPELELTVVRDELDLATVERDSSVGSLNARTIERTTGLANLENWNRPTEEALDFVIRNKTFYSPYENGYMRREMISAGNRIVNNLGVHGNVNYFAPGVDQSRTLWWGQDLVGLGDKMIHAAFSGRIRKIWREANFGVCLDLASPDNVWLVRYHHIEQITGLKVGDLVSPDQIIAREDSLRGHIHTIAAFNYRGGPQNWKLVPITEIVAEAPTKLYRAGNYRDGAGVAETYFAYVARALTPRMAFTKGSIKEAQVVLDDAPVTKEGVKEVYVALDASRADEEEIDLTIVEEIPDLEVVMARYPIKVGNKEQKVTVPLRKKDLEAKLLDENRIPSPKPLVVDYYLGGRIKLDVSDDIWEYLSLAYQLTGVSPYLLLALLHSETVDLGGKLKGGNTTSPVGAGGLFQFMPKTWESHTEGMANLRYDPLASALAAGKMISSIGLSEKFNNALRAKVEEDERCRQDLGRKRDNTIFNAWKKAFTDQFAGKTKEACWNMHPAQANYVFETALALTQDNSDVVSVLWN